MGQKTSMIEYPTSEAGPSRAYREKMATKNWPMEHLHLGIVDICVLSVRELVVLLSRAQRLRINKVLFLFKDYIHRRYIG